MALKGQLLELRNEGHFQFLLRVGIYDDLMPGQPSYLYPEGVEEEGLPLDKEILVYECRLDFSDAEKPVSYPLGDLAACMDIYEEYETPANLSPEQEKLWKTAFIVDTIIAEAFSTDVLEVIHGDDYDQGGQEGEEWQEGREPPAADGAGGRQPAALTPVRCPDCGAPVKAVAGADGRRGHTYACEICGRYFAA